MSDKISPKDRAMIDRAIADGRIKKVPMGKGGECRLLSPKWEKKGDATETRKQNMTLRAETRKTVEQMVELINSGLTPREAAGVIGVSGTAINYYLNIAKARGWL